MLNKLFPLIAILFVLCASVARAQENVVASIKPLHSLVAGVMEGGGTPLLLVDGKASPHSFMLRPSQMRALENASVVFYMGDSFEMFLAPVMDQLPSKTERVSMEKLPGMTLYPLRISGNFDPDEDERGNDLHLWMDPRNAKVMVAAIADRLATLYPEHAALYRANAARLEARLDALDAHLRAELTPLKGKPFIVFHDAYQYLEKAYGLDSVGSITLFPERTPSARHMEEIRAKIRTVGARCVFREPQFDSRIIDNLLAGTNAKSAVLDPEGALLTPGPELYFQLMNGIADGLKRCLSS